MTAIRICLKKIISEQFLIKQWKSLWLKKKKKRHFVYGYLNSTYFQKIRVHKTWGPCSDLELYGEYMLALLAILNSVVNLSHLGFPKPWPIYLWIHYHSETIQNLRTWYTVYSDLRFRWISLFCTPCVHLKKASSFERTLHTSASKYWSMKHEEVLRK